MDKLIFFLELIEHHAGEVKETSEYEDTSIIDYHADRIQFLSNKLKEVIANEY